MSHPDHAEPIEFKNEQVHAVMLLKPACAIELRVHALPPLINTARREAIKFVSKSIAIPGFRKGRAPEEIIRKKFPNDIEKELHNRLADTAFAEAQKLAKIPLLNNRSTITYDLKKISEEGADLVFNFETEPKIPHVDPKLFQPKPIEKAEVGEKQIEEAIRQMQFFFADWTPVIDRPIQEKDYILIDVDTIEGEKPERVFNQVRFEVSRERMAEWMQRLVIGAKMGDVVEGISEPDADATEAEKQEFKPKKVRITIFKVEEAKLPPLDDDFAKKIGSSDVTHMRQSITDMLTRRVEETEREQLREQVNKFFTEQHSFPIPESLVKAERDHRLQQLMQNPEFKRDWAKMEEEARKAFEEKLTIESTHAVRLFYLSRHIVNEEKIGVTHKEVQDEAVATLRGHGTTDIPVDKIPREVFALALSKVMLAKAQDFVIEKQKA